MWAFLLLPTKKKVQQSGFTIVELLIVIVVIGILAAITIVAFNGVQNRARAASAQQAASQANGKITLFAAENADSYPVAAGAAGMDNLDSIGIRNSGATTFQFSSDNTSTPHTYCLTATTGNISYYISSTVTSPTAGACPGHGVNGVAAITNIVRNPTAVSSGPTAEWSGRYGMGPSWVTGASDGPPGTGLTTYWRQTQGTTPVTGGGRGIDHRINTDLANPSIDTTWAVTAGSPITASIYVRSSLANTNAQMLYRLHDGAGNWLAPSVGCTSTNYTTPGTWIRISCVITPSASGYIALTSRFNQSITWTAGATIDGTGLSIVAGSTLYTYADGNSTNWVWNGVANNSTSTGPPSQ